MNIIKNHIIKLFMICIFVVVPYAEINATANSSDKSGEYLAVRVRPNAEVKASPVRASVRRDARSDRMEDEQESYEEEFTDQPDEEPNE